MLQNKPLHKSPTDFIDLTQQQRILLEAFERDAGLCQTFYFSGGTLLKAVGIIPRISNDIDFFSFPDMDSRVVFSQRENFYDACRALFGKDTIGETQCGIIHRPSGMVIDFAAGDVRIIGDFVSYGNLKTASIEDCAANKASALCSRDEIKDYIDIAFLSKNRGWSLKDFEEMAEKKFGLGTITEEKLLTELLAKQAQFDIPLDIFLRDPEINCAFVKEQISFLVEHTSL